jgi:hypothetical protein
LFFGSYAFDTWKSVDHLRSYLNYDRANNKLGCFQLNKPTDMHLRSPRHYAETIIPEVIEELDSGHYQ